MITDISVDFNNIDKIVFDYISINPDSRMNDVKFPLQFIKKSFNIDILNLNILIKIDEAFIKLIRNKELLPGYQKLQYQLKYATAFRRIIEAITTYKFKSNFFNKGNTYVVYKYLDTYEIPINKKIIDNFILYLETTNLKIRTKRQAVTDILKYITPLFEKIENNTLIRDDLLQVLQTIENNSSIERKTKVKDMRSTDISETARTVCTSINIFIKSKVIDCSIIACTEIIAKIKNIIIQDKDYFDDEELEKIANAYENDRERLIFTIFLTTGIRIGGLLNMKVKDVYDKDLYIKEDGQTLEEKGNKIRKFKIFPALKQALEKYRDSNFGIVLKSPEHYIFCSYNKKSKTYTIPSLAKCTSGAIQHVVKNVCNRAGVTGSHVHTHAFRKTLVIKLMNEKNTIDDVSKFIGHSSSSITAKHYWTPTQNDLLRTMNLSWLISNNKDGTTSYDSSSFNTRQMKEIVSHIIEGLKAKERLIHAMSLMSQEQINNMNKLWTIEIEKQIAENARKEISKILNALNTLSEYNDNSIYVSDSD